jgi:hypothetical protein
MTDDMDRTTLLLHRRTEGLPAELPRAADLRQRAEHGRRTRRTVTGVVAAAIAVVTAVAVTTGGTGPDKPDPVVTPTPSPTTSDALSLRVTPLMSPADWRPLLAQRVTAFGFSAGLGCSVDIPEAAANTDDLMGLYRQEDGAQLTEFLHPFVDAGAASLNFTGFRDRLMFCHSDAPGFDVTEASAVPALMRPAGPLDEVFVGKSTKGEPYQVAVARDDNIVVVLESNGEGFPGLETLETALARAIRGAAGRCAVAVARHGAVCRPDAPGIARRPYRLAAEPALDAAGWTDLIDEIDRLSETPLVTPGCLGSSQEWGAQRLWRSSAEYDDGFVINEYVLDGGTASRTAALFDTMVARWRNCGSERAPRDPDEAEADRIRAGFDDLFESSMEGEAGYSVGMARARNVVVVLEVSGFIDRGTSLLEMAMDRAVTEQMSPYG